jgi:uncharacterized membrane protein (DUF485 family)
MPAVVNFIPTIQIAKVLEFIWMAEKEELTPQDWEQIAASDEFKTLVAAKRRFILPAVIFFIVYYFALPVLVGYAPELMATKIFGVVNLAYLFALSQFFMAWILAAIYVKKAGSFDALAQKIIHKHKK